MKYELFDERRWRMRTTWLNDKNVCIPFRVGEGPSERGPRLGGRAPDKVSPRLDAEGIKYFATLPLSLAGEFEVSIFATYDFDTMSEVTGQVEMQGLVQLVVHEASKRGPDSSLKSPLSAHPLILGDPKLDVSRSEDGDPEVESSHKLGGRPALIEPSRAAKSLEKLELQGFTQVAQVDFPVTEGDADVSGNWPFADGLFHILGRAPYRGDQDWRWFFEF